MKLSVQIGQALSFIHDTLGIAHNDLKPDNFFASKEAQERLSEDDDGVGYYLADFGYAKEIGFHSS